MLEETGLKVNMVGHLGVTNDVFEPESPGLPVKHYVTVFVRCRLEDPDAEPKVSHHPPPYFPRLLQSCPLTWNSFENPRVLINDFCVGA